MAKVELKQPIVQAIADDVKDAASVVLVDVFLLKGLKNELLKRQIVVWVCRWTSNMDHPIRPLLIVATVYGLGRKKSTPALAPRPGVNLTKIFLPP